jgi:hypothetical protein
VAAGDRSTLKLESKNEELKKKLRISLKIWSLTMGEFEVL